MKDYYTISEISKLYGIGTDSLRYYEEIGALEPKQMCIRDREGIPGTRMEKEWKKENLKNGACWRERRELRCSSLLSL